MLRGFVANWVWVALSVWAVGCLAGFGALWVYANTPGDESASLTAIGGIADADNPYRLPAEFRARAGKPTLAMFAHPKCPCTRATTRELERLQADAAGRFETVVFFYEPADADPEDWRSTELWKMAERMHDTRTIVDAGGALASAAGATTSGTIGLFDASGRAVFWGGLTSSRGHEGASRGGAILRRLLTHPRKIPSASLTMTTVYGCGLQTPSGEAGSAGSDPNGTGPNDTGPAGPELAECGEACGGD